MVTPEEEPLVLKQFLCFGETRAIVGLMSARHLPSSVADSVVETSGGTPDVLTGEDLVASTSGFKGKRPVAEGRQSDKSAVGGASPRPLLSSPVLHFAPSAKVGTGLRPRLKQVWFGSSIYGGDSFRRSFLSGRWGSISCRRRRRVGVWTFTTHLHLPSPPGPRQQGGRGGSLVAFVAKASMTKVRWQVSICPHMTH